MAMRLALLALALGLSVTLPAAAAPGEVRKDPNGVKGVSPFWEALKKGDNAYLARDWEGAIAAYREAIQQDPQNPMGHYRVGSAQLAKGDTSEAQAAWTQGLRVASDPAMRAKLLFVMADLRERQKSHDDAAESWTAYEQHVARETQSRGYPNTPKERKRRIEEWKKISEAAAIVRARIEKRAREVAASMPPPSTSER